jgi:hypothetical protein
MRVVYLGFVLIAAGAYVAGAQRRAPKDGDGVSLSEVKLPRVVRMHMERELFDGVVNKYDREDLKDSSKVIRVRLGPGNRWGWRMLGGPKLCGRGANCPFWIFDAETGAVLLTGAAGYDFSFRRAIHGGLYDVQIPESTGAVESSIVHRYEFDGRQYEERK